MLEEINYLCEKVKESGKFPTGVTYETLGHYLCGSANWELVKEPFSQEFLCNVVYNSKDSMYAILLLQLSYLYRNSEDIKAVDAFIELYNKEKV